MWIFKAYFAEDREYFEYDATGVQGYPAITKEQPLLESLLSFLELDLTSVEPKVEEICENWDQFFKTGSRSNSDRAMILLSELRQQHIYFQLEYLRCFAQLSQQNLMSEMVENLQRLPEQLLTYQKQIQCFFDQVLDIDQVGREIQMRMRENYCCNQPVSTDLFSFRPVPVAVEAMPLVGYVDVLYPNDIRDFIDFSLRECVRRQMPVRRCKSCGRYFPLTVRVTAEYCSRPTSSGRLCRATGAIQTWTEKRKEDDVFQLYRREYKRRFAWIKAGKITEEEFYHWSEAARAKKKECGSGILSLDKFKEWLKNS